MFLKEITGTFPNSAETLMLAVSQILSETFPLNMIINPIDLCILISVLMTLNKDRYHCGVGQVNLKVMCS